MCILFTENCYDGFKDHGTGDFCIPYDGECAFGYKDDGTGMKCILSS